MTDEERPMAMTVAQIRERYKGESRDWIHERVGDLCVLKAQADAVGDVSSGGIGGMIDELRAFLQQVPADTPASEAGPPPVVRDAEDVLLRVLTHMIRAGERPNSQELLARAQEDEPALLAGWTAKRVERAFGRFGCKTDKSYPSGLPDSRIPF